MKTTPSRYFKLSSISLLMMTGFSALASNSGTDLNLSHHIIAGSMGGAAYTKPQEASSAIFGNPATMSQFSGYNFDLSATFLQITELKNTQTTNITGIDTFSNESISAADDYILPSFGAVFEYSDTVSLGFGLEVDAGIGADFRNDPITLMGGAGNALGLGSPVSLPLVVELVSLNANVAGAWQVNKQLALGASVTTGFGLAQLGTTGNTEGLTALNSALGNPGLSDFGGTTANVHDTAFAGSLGAVYQISKNSALSLAWKSQLTI